MATYGMWRHTGWRLGDVRDSDVATPHAWGHRSAAPCCFRHGREKQGRWAALWRCTAHYGGWEAGQSAGVNLGLQRGTALIWGGGGGDFS